MLDGTLFRETSCSALPYLQRAPVKRPESRTARSFLIDDDLSAAVQQPALELREGFEGIIGESRPMEQVFALARRVAPTDGTVLLTGESGTGKEVFVRAIHRLSRRKDCPLLACDCSALVPTLLESELFGHVKGSFSGAVATKEGLFEAADRGTLFLDEVGNLSMETQGKLLRVLETRRVKKVGDTAEREVDIRLISATNRELSEMVREGTFREDLYYRLNVVPIHLPPLRDRQGDISRLAGSFLDKFCRKNQTNAKGFSPEAMCLMERYAWPGNVRELRNIVERLAILCDEDRIEPHDLPEEIRSVALRTAIRQQELADTPHRSLAEVEREYIQRVLAATDGNRRAAARILGIGEATVYRHLRESQLDR